MKDPHVKSYARQALTSTTRMDERVQEIREEAASYMVNVDKADLNPIFMINAVYSIRRYLPNGLKLVPTADTAEFRLIKEVMTNITKPGVADHLMKGCWSVDKLSAMIKTAKEAVENRR